MGSIQSSEVTPDLLLKFGDSEIPLVN